MPLGRYEMEKIDTVVLYHKQCNDGFGSAYAHWYWNNRRDNTLYYSMSYGDKIPDCVNDDTNVIFLDFSLKVEEMEELVQRVNSVLVVDHHKTALALHSIQDIYENLSLVLDMGHSGCVLTWITFAPLSTSIPEFLLLIEDRDLWKFKYIDSKAFHAGLHITDEDFTSLSNLHIARKLEEVIYQGNVILEYKKVVLLSIANQAYVDTIQGHTAIFVNCPPMLSSDLADVLRNEYAGVAVVVLYSILANTVLYSLRGNNSLAEDAQVDVSKIAEHFGGGGHKLAAGFSLRLEESHLIHGL